MLELEKYWELELSIDDTGHFKKLLENGTEQSKKFLEEYEEKKKKRLENEQKNKV